MLIFIAEQAGKANHPPSSQKSMTSAPSCAACPCSLRIDTHKKIESATVGTYKGVENYLVDAYKAIETAFVDRFLEKVEDENNEQ